MSLIKLREEMVIKIKRSEIKNLKQQALAVPLKRARFCLHRDAKDPLQDMVIVLCKDSYVAPHRHKGRDESLCVIEGSFYLVVFNERGQVIEKILLKRDDHPGYLICRIKEGTWHTVIPRSDFVVIHEIIRGPFKRSKAAALPLWVPQQKDEIRRFITAVASGAFYPKER